MSKNHVQPGAVMPWTNSTGSAVVSGQLLLVGLFACIALGDIANGANGMLAITEVWKLSKPTDEAVTQGAALYRMSAVNKVSSLVDNATAWVAATAYALADYAIPTTANGHYYKCTTAGTSHATTEPTWPTDGSTVTDGTAVWTDMGTIQKVGSAFAAAAAADSTVQTKLNA